MKADMSLLLESACRRGASRTKSGHLAVGIAGPGTRKTPLVAAVTGKQTAREAASKLG
jgi:hypothetical protein